MSKFFEIETFFCRTFSRAQRTLVASIVVATCVLYSGSAFGQLSIYKSADMTLDANALLMPSNSQFSRSINGKTHQSDPLITHDGYQFAAWYRNGANNEQDVILARRDLSTNIWTSFDTGVDMANGDEDGDGNGSGVWDSHNTVNLGISGDGRIHLAYDHHRDDLRYLTTKGVNKATNTTWDPSIFVDAGERSKFNAQDTGRVDNLTYPRFAPKPDGDLVAVYRVGGSGNGDTDFVSYNSSTQRWGASHEIINGNVGTYTDQFNNSSSTSRNAYLNGIDSGADGTLHMTWTWRENSSDPNHDINYAFSDDNGNTWKNNDGTVVANVATGLSITLNSPGIIIDGGDLDRTQSLMNQQGQTVDDFGGVHALMWHRRDDGVNGEFDWVPGERFNGSKSAYYHYYRDPLTGDWARSQLPTERGVGTRPKIGYDANGDLFAVYTSASRLVIAGATKDAGYSDWSILWDRDDDNQRFTGEASLDQTRLLEDGVLSVFVQEDSATTGVTGSNLRVLEFNVVSAVPEPSSLTLILAAGVFGLTRRRRS